MQKFLIVTTLVFMAAAASAAITPILSVAPHFTSMDGLSYQFHASGSDGQPVADGSHVLVFSIWNDPGSGGTMLWSESQTVVTTDGLGNVMLGSVVPIPLDVFGVGGGDTTKALYLDITLDSEPISPRTRLLPAPFARVAERLLGGVVTGVADVVIENPGGLGDTVVFLGVSDSKAQTVHLKLTIDGNDIKASPSGVVLTDPTGDTTASYGKENMVLSNIGSSGEDGVSVELTTGRDSTGELEARMTYYGLIDDGSRAKTSKPKEIVVVGSKVKEVVRFYENDFENDVADRSYVRGRATGVRVHSPLTITGAALPDTTPGYERRVDSLGTEIMLAKNNTDGTSNWLETRIDTGGSSSAVVHSDPGQGIVRAGIIQADASGSNLTISNIGSSGEDGVWIDAGEGDVEIKLGIEHEDIGAKFHASDDGSGAGLTLFDISATGDTGKVEIGAHELGHNLDMGYIGSSGIDGLSIAVNPDSTVLRMNKADLVEVLASTSSNRGQLTVSNIGSSGQDGVSICTDPDGAFVALLDSVGDTAILITTQPQPSGPTRGSKLFVGSLSYGDNIDLTLSGRIGIGVSNPANILEVARNSTTDPIADAWGTYSSRRWKENISPINNALAKIGMLRGVEYDWKKDGKHDIGLIAEEVGEVFPEIVAYEENGVDARSVDYGRLTPLLVEAIKELRQQNEDLKRRIEQLESR